MRISSADDLAVVETGQLLGAKYRIEEPIGEGGMATVFRARHEQLGELLAIKFLKPEFANNDEVVERFTREAMAAVRLKSEHIARVSDVGTTPAGIPYMVMEYLEGHDLGRVVESG